MENPLLQESPNPHRFICKINYYESIIRLRIIVSRVNLRFGLIKYRNYSMVIAIYEV